MERKIDVEITNRHDIGVVAFRATSISDTEGINQASAQIKEFVEENRLRKVVFDFEPVKFFSSGVLGVLIDIRNRLEKNGGEVVISGIIPQLYRVFKITNLDRIFRFFPDRESALEAVGTG